MLKKLTPLITVLLILLVTFQSFATAECSRCFDGAYEWYFICNGTLTHNGSYTHTIWTEPYPQECTISVYSSYCTAYCRYCTNITSLRYMSHLCRREHSLCIPSIEQPCMYPK